MPTNRNPVIRRSGSVNRRKPVSRKKPLGPRLFVLLVVLALIVAAIVFLPKLFARENKPEAGSSSSAASALIPTQTPAATGLPAEADPASTPAPGADYDSLTPAAERDISSAEVQAMNTMMVVGNSGYRYYTFNEALSIAYIKLVAAAQNRLGDSAKVYDMVIPTATDIMLPQSFLADKNTSDQQKAIDYLYASMGEIAPHVTTVPVFDILKANCDKDIYFQTDRRWTALGAYYAYRQLAKSLEFTPFALTDFEEKTVPGFTGSLYAQSDSKEALNHTEDIATYTPNANITVTYSDGSTGTLIQNAADADAGNKINTFMGGDRAYIKIENSDITDGSSCVVVKDFMGSLLLPYLAAHYQTIYAVDYRYYSGSVTDLMQENSVKTLLLLTQIEATSDNEFIQNMSAILPAE